MRQKLIEERNKKGLTQKQVADAIGISAVFVRKIEKGLRNPGRETMLKFEKLYGIQDRKLFPELFRIGCDTKCIDTNTA